MAFWHVIAGSTALHHTKCVKTISFCGAGWVALAGQAGLAGVAWLAGLRLGLAGLAGVTGQLGHHGLRELSKEAHWFGGAHRAAIFILPIYYLSITYPITYPIAHLFLSYYLSIS